MSEHAARRVLLQAWHTRCEPLGLAPLAAMSGNEEAIDMLNWDTIAGRWSQLKGDLRTTWAKLTDDDISLAGAKKDKLVGIIQERYGILRDDAERQVDQWMARLENKLH